jgi:lipopolysaccharide/colanic/teichoic acid biosynthesis glycosyltransferase
MGQPASEARSSHRAPGHTHDRVGRSSWNLAERGLALLLLLVAAPLVLALAAFVLLVDGRPAFYRGPRLGRGRKTFTIYKLRTLQRGAEKVVGGELLKHSHPLVLRGGAFLRDTRLDELPQLLNVVRGDMAFLGPRPERPEVYRAQCQAIPGYDRRFAVRPGLIGSSQLFTPHGTAKRYRTLLDNSALRRRRNLAADVGVVAFTAWSVLVKACARMRRKLRALPRLLLRSRGRERRRLRRITRAGAAARFHGDPFARTWRVVDLQEESALLEGSRVAAVPSGQALMLDLELALERGAERPTRRTVRCTAEIVAQRPGARAMRLVVRFRPATERGEYMLHQYFLGTSLASPRASWRPAGALRAPIQAPAIAPPAPPRAGAPRRETGAERVAAHARHGSRRS